MPNVITNLTEQQHEDLFVDACEGGSNYWLSLGKKGAQAIKIHCPIEFEGEPISLRFWQTVKSGYSVNVYDVETNKIIGTISMGSITKGEQLMAEQYPAHWADLISDRGDAITADVWFQLCSLGELVYG